MGVFAKLLRRSSGKTPGGSAAARPAPDAAEQDTGGDTPGASAAPSRDAGEDAPASAGARPAAGDENAPAVGQKPAPAAAGEHDEPAQEPPVDPDTATAQPREEAEADGGVGIPKQQSADAAADSGTGDNARK